jgi:tRNA (guanine26-N2/guanine27-N2)-dimethyltransferase
MHTTCITEGVTKIQVPVSDANAQFPPGTAPVFYNPRMQFNRDMTVLLTSYLKPSTYLDAMGATGMRGFRIAYETLTPPAVTINDYSLLACELMQKNSTQTGINCIITHREANALMSEQRFEMVDLDPFGTPAPFIDAACKSAHPYLCITATDTAPLCGAHLKAGIRRYDAMPMNTEYHPEVGLRILLGYVVRMIVKYDKGVIPLLCYVREHYVRLIVKLVHGANQADNSIKRLGYVYQCTSCPYVIEEAGRLEQKKQESICPHCGIRLRAIGPLWMGSICDTDVIDGMLALLPALPQLQTRAIEKLLVLCRDEPAISFHYDYHRISKRCGRSAIAMDTYLTRLRERGYYAEKTHYTGTGVKTDAPLTVLYEALNP